MFVSETLKVVINNKEIFVGLNEPKEVEFEGVTFAEHDEEIIIRLLTSIARFEGYTIFKTGKSAVSLDQFTDEVFLNIIVDTFPNDNSTFVTYEDFYDYDNQYEREFLIRLVEVALNVYGYEMLPVVTSNIADKDCCSKLRLVLTPGSFSTYGVGIDENNDEEVISALALAAHSSGYDVRKNNNLKYVSSNTTGLVDINFHKDNSNNVSTITYTDENGNLISDENMDIVKELLKFALRYLNYELIVAKGKF